MERHWHAVAETAAFSAQADEMLSSTERDAVVNEIALDPDGGVLIPGAAGLRKRRISLMGRGKRGGARVVTLYLGRHLPVYAVFLFSKNERADLSAAQRKRLGSLVDDIKRRARARLKR